MARGSPSISNTIDGASIRLQILSYPNKVRVMLRISASHVSEIEAFEQQLLEQEARNEQDGCKN